MKRNFLFGIKILAGSIAVFGALCNEAKQGKKSYKYQKSRDKNILFTTDNIIFYWDSWHILELIRAFSNAIQQRKTGGFEDQELQSLHCEKCNTLLKDVKQAWRNGQMELIPVEIFSTGGMRTGFKFIYNWNAIILLKPKRSFHGAWQADSPMHRKGNIVETMQLWKWTMRANTSCLPAELCISCSKWSFSLRTQISLFLPRT